VIATDLWISRGESTTYKVGFYPGNMQERLARGSVVNKDLTLKTKAKDSTFVLEDSSRPRTKAKDNTG